MFTSHLINFVDIFKEMNEEQGKKGKATFGLDEVIISFCIRQIRDSLRENPISTVLQALQPKNRNVSKHL